MLPARPRLRALFFYEGDVVICELALMEEDGQAVNDQRLTVLPGSGLEQYRYAMLALMDSLMGVALPEKSEAQMSEEELQLERSRRDELAALGWHHSVLRVLPGDAPIEPVETGGLRVQRERPRITPDTVIDNQKPAPPEPAARLTIEQVQAERARRAAAQTR